MKPFQIVILAIALLLIGVITWQYLQIQDLKQDQIQELEAEETAREKIRDSLTLIIDGRNKSLDSIQSYNDSLKHNIEILTNYVQDNSDVDNASSTELGELLSRYYNK